jgi:hypothetical protein
MHPELDHLIATFFQAVSFEQGGSPAYHQLYDLFLDNGLLIKNSSAVPEITTVSQFIEPRTQLVASGQLTAFNEVELTAITEMFGNVAHRFSTYAKTGVQNGNSFAARGMISTQFVMTPSGWKISAMAWDDERPGLTIPERYVPTASSAANERSS